MLTKLNKSPVSSNEGGILAGLWRSVISDHKYTSRLPRLVERYITIRENNDKLPGAKKTKSTLVADITSGSMTWSVLANLLFNLLGVRSVTLYVGIKYINHENKDTTTSSKITIDSESDNAMVMLRNKIFLDGAILQNLQFYMDRYLGEIDDGGIGTIRRRAKSKMHTNITASKLSWKTVSNIIFRLLSAYSLTVTIKLILPNGTPIASSITARTGK